MTRELHNVLLICALCIILFAYTNYNYEDLNFYGLVLGDNKKYWQGM